MFFEKRLLERESETDFVAYLENFDVQSEFSGLVQECLQSQKKREEVERGIGNWLIVFEHTGEPLQHAGSPCSIVRARLALKEIIRRLPEEFWPEIRDMAIRLDRLAEQTAASRLCWVNLQAYKPDVFASLGLTGLT